MSKEARTKTTDKQKKGKKKAPIWHFPDARRCPRCRGYDTAAYHTDTKKGRQYRKCNAPICRWRYSVNGKKIKKAKTDKTKSS